MEYFTSVPTSSFDSLYTDFIPSIAGLSVSQPLSFTTTNQSSLFPLYHSDWSHWGALIQFYVTANQIRSFVFEAATLGTAVFFLDNSETPFTDPRNPFSARFLHFFVVITIASFYWLRRRRRENRTDFRGKQFHWRTTAVVPPISCRRRCDAFPAQNARAHVATGIFGFLRHCATAAKMAPFRPTGGNVGGNRRNAPGAKFHTCRKKRPWRNKHVVLVVGGRSTPAGIACECVSLSRIT